MQSTEAIDIISASLTTEGFNEYLRGNIFKYLMRYKHKGKPREDLKKAKWYLNRLIDEVE
tara:strand:+ start:3701 stop:3880 length:180 start_codon:yes stop_codon:yes gene_type:complete